MYSVVLDSVNSYLVPVESGMTFALACQCIIDYCREHNYSLQEDIWEVNKETGKI